MSKLDLLAHYEQGSACAGNLPVERRIINESSVKKTHKQ